MPSARRSHRGDGRADNERRLQQSREQSRRFISFDMAGSRQSQQAVISAVHAGCDCGRGRPAIRSSKAIARAIRDGGIAVDRNLAAFDASVASAREASEGGAKAVPGDCATWQSERFPTRCASASQSELPPGCAGRRDSRRAPVDRLPGCRLREPVSRCAAAYPRSRVQRSRVRAKLTDEVARGLALWMSFEDTIRVADLKTRADRKRRVLAAILARPGQLVHVVEFMSPRVEEICGTLPAGMGRAMLRLAALVVADFARVRRPSDANQHGVAATCCCAACPVCAAGGAARCDSRRSMRESRAGWITSPRRLAGITTLPSSLPRLQHLVRGYGDTFERGPAHLRAVTREQPTRAGRQARWRAGAASGCMLLEMAGI